MNRPKVIEPPNVHEAGSPAAAAQAFVGKGLHATQKSNPVSVETSIHGMRVTLVLLRYCRLRPPSAHAQWEQAGNPAIPVLHSQYTGQPPKHVRIPQGCEVLGGKEDNNQAVYEPSKAIVPATQIGLQWTASLWQ